MRRVLVVLSVVFPMLGCAATSGSLCDEIASASRADAGTIRRIVEILDAVAGSGRVTDPCATEAAIDATLRLNIRKNIPVVRGIVNLSYAEIESAGERRMIEDTIAQALHALSLLDDPEATSLARHHLGSPASIAGVALITLRARGDWQSTSAVVDRLMSDPDPRRNFSLVWLALEFLSDSPQRGQRGCAALLRLGVFEELPAPQLKDPTIARIIMMRRSLMERYECSDHLGGAGPNS